MARRQSRRLVAVLIALAVAACSGGGSAGTTSTSIALPSSTTSTTTSSTTTPTTPQATPTSVGTTSTSAGSTATSEPALANIDAEIVVPSGDGPFPTVVLVHGGGWVAGDPSIMRPLAAHLNDNGFLTVNTRYQLATLREPGFPQAVADVACAVRVAAAHPRSDGTVAVVGHSAGAHLGALVALTGDEYADGCVTGGSGVPERFVGLAGPYDVSRLGLAMQVFFGAGPDEAPELWAAGNPQQLTDENPWLDSLIMYGELDRLVEDSFAIEFFTALEESGSSSSLQLVEGARHNDMHDPDLVGELIVTWLER